MMDIKEYMADFHINFPYLGDSNPWEITQAISSIIPKRILEINTDDYTITAGIAIHKTAVIEQGAILKGPLIISENCFVASHAYIRSGVYLGRGVRIGPGSEIKSSIIGSNSALAHFNYIGDSIIGSDVNFEAGALIANHYNERDNKNIWVQINGQRKDTGTIKFGALVGDHSKIGANAVLSPGTILNKCSLVKRLELIEQNK